jgi:tol-pal system protein YbgF
VNIIRLGSLGILSLGLIAGSAPAMAQSTSERLQLIEQRLSRMERIVDNNDSATDMLRRIQELQSENQALRNEIETLQFQTVQSADRERELYLDLDQRLQALESGAAAGTGRIAGSATPGAVAAGGSDNAGGFAGTGGTGVAGTGGAGVAGTSDTAAGSAAGASAGTDMADYSAAFELLKQGRYPEAAAGFKGFLAAYPNSELRDNAEYWLAETYYVVEDFGAALTGFQSVINNYPASRKIPDAWLKIGYCNYELKRWDDARQALSIAESRFPESTAAKLASQRLQVMSSEGH